MQSLLDVFQFFDSTSSTYTYLISDKASGDIAIVDPVIENLERDTQWINRLGGSLRWILETHIHADHITGAHYLRKKFSTAQIGLSANAEATGQDLSLLEGEELALGAQSIHVLETPGHTTTCLSFSIPGAVFTGDALLILGTGRTDFQGGSASQLFASIHSKIFTMPPGTVIYPGHDYKGQTSSKVGLEARWNPRVGGGRTVEEFTDIMKNLKLANPKKIHEALPANLRCGDVRLEDV